MGSGGGGRLKIPNLGYIRRSPYRYVISAAFTTSTRFLSFSSGLDSQGFKCQHTLTQDIMCLNLAELASPTLKTRNKRETTKQETPVCPGLSSFKHSELRIIKRSGTSVIGFKTSHHQNQPTDEGHMSSCSMLYYRMSEA